MHITAVVVQKRIHQPTTLKPEFMKCNALHKVYIQSCCFVVVVVVVLLLLLCKKNVETSHRSKCP